MVKKSTPHRSLRIGLHEQNPGIIIKFQNPHPITHYYPQSLQTTIQPQTDTSEFLVRKGNSRKKRCSSCFVQKTPYWRDGWDDSVLLCNACGIRYQKYKKYCGKCFSIARKDEKGRLHCPTCSDKL